MNRVKRRGAVGAIDARNVLSVLPKEPYPLYVTRSDWVTWRVGV